MEPEPEGTPCPPCALKICGVREAMGGQNVTTTAASGSETGTGVELDMDLYEGADLDLYGSDPETAKALEAAEAEWHYGGSLTITQLWELTDALDMSGPSCRAASSSTGR